MDRIEQNDNMRQVRRKQVPSYVQPLAYDEAVLLSSAQNHVFNLDPEREARGQSHELRNIKPGRGSQTQLTSATTTKRQKEEPQDVPPGEDGIYFKGGGRKLTSFVLPVVESLSQYKWNWYKSPRPLKDFGAFDEASRGPWGSLKLLLTTKGRQVNNVKLPGNDSALTQRNEGYFWVTANSNSRRDVMFPINQIIPRSLNTPPEEAMPYHQASCRTNNCTWPLVTSLAVCVDMKNVTNLLASTGGPYGQPINATLPNGLFIQHTSGYATMNISTGPGLSFNNTDIMNAKLFHFFVLYGPRLRATEIIMHWCVNTYRVSVQENIPVTQRVASHTIRSSGEVFIKNYNQTMNQTYFTSPDSPNDKYYVGGHGPDQIASVLESTLVGTSSDFGQYRYGNGCEIYVTALSRAQIGINTANESQKLDDAQFTTLRNLTENIASGLTNA
ncbi:uncharacterized protein GLRG_09465 [Colletotrichum graminicola M1.001]|uniref:Uncharacterized protein n=1 Tax=Colletotrichum graminicola (strain M1.001 / M2 / FGSC 10212) TaxID=645133 RepID=E3QTY3_COLGM|nr:uncharacterized protein GLRG_09465 [Colletotrichum graminicola M1.001]EFQ34321.1 hypothetical protein GLRG_09465 [Colletotrichum graminicola M1.001]